MAIALRREGIDCLVISEGRKNAFIPGESLAPNTMLAMQQLGAAHLLQSPEHTVYTGNTVVWGNDTIRSRYFIKEPYGNGWHLNRLSFEAQLRTLAEQLGAQWRDQWRVHHIGHNGRMEVSCTNQQKELLRLRADMVIDCTGRASAIARRCGARKLTLDRLTAFCMVAQLPAAALHGMTCIEAAQDGWWYAAPIGHGRVVINFMTDSDLADAGVADLRGWMQRRFAQLQHLPSMIPLAQATDCGGVQVHTATTAFLERPCGPGWMAVGDALCAYDPLTSYGITAALAACPEAAKAIRQHINGNDSGLRNYAAIQQNTFNKSVDMLQQQYGLERRWRHQLFWQRRHLVHA